MRYVYYALIILSSISLILTARESKKSRHSQSRLLIYLCVGGLITTISASLICLNLDATYVNITHSFFLACTSWLILTLYKFMLVYTGKIDNYKNQKFLRYSLTEIDSIILSTNVFTNFAYDVKITGNLSHTITPHIGLYLHYIYIYFYIIVILYYIIKSIIKSESVYRARFESIMGIYIVITTLSFFEGVGYFKFIYSVFGYSILAFTIYRFTSKYVPNSITNYVKNKMMEEAKDAIICFDNENNFTYTNRQGRYYLKTRGKCDNIVALAEKIYEDYDKIYDFKNTEEVIFEVTKNRKNYKITVETLKGKNNKVVASTVTIHDETEELRKHKEEIRKVSHDSLTKLYNREYIQNKLPGLLKSNKDKEYYVLYTDIKNFKIINDYYGPLMGDKILKIEASIIDKLLKHETDTLYGRLGSDNFVIIIPVEKYNKLNIKKELDSVNKILKLDMKLYIYIGIYKISDINMNASLMIDHALMALKKVKKNYKEFIGFYDEGYRSSILKEQKMVSDLPKALKKNEFKMYLQPQTSTDGKIIGAEALVRWQKNDEIISPGEFIKVYETTGLIHKLDLFIWECAVKKIAEWESRGIKDLYISINISPEDFHSLDLLKTIDNLVDKYKIDKKRIKLEITESIFIEQTSDIIKLIDGLRKAGYKVEMDDFGSGYSSLNQLKNINVDVVKMDMGFLYDVENQDKSNAILSTLIDLSKNLGYEVVTEGVETKQQYDYLTKIGCDVFQGYYIDKPMKIEDFEKKYLEDININEKIR